MTWRQILAMLVINAIITLLSIWLFGCRHSEHHITIPVPEKEYAFISEPPKIKFVQLPDKVIFEANIPEEEPCSDCPESFIILDMNYIGCVQLIQLLNHENITLKDVNDFLKNAFSLKSRWIIVEYP